MVQTGKCPSCHAVNSFKVRDCIDCRQPLPWASAVDDFQAQIQVAQTKAQQATQQVATLTTQQTAANVRSQMDARTPTRTPTGAPPGEVLPVNVFEIFADSFVGRFAIIFEGMEKGAAIIFGLLCAAFYTACIIGGFYLALQNFASLLGSFFPHLGPAVPDPALLPPGTPPTLTPPGLTPPTLTPAAPANLSFGAPQLFQFVAVCLSTWLAVFVGCVAARKIFGGEERHIEGDVFVSGVCLVPIGLSVVATGALGFSNWQLSAVLAVVGLCYSIMLLYRGLTTVSRIRDMAAALCVPVILISSAYMTKVVLMRLAEAAIGQ